MYVWLFFSLLMWMLNFLPERLLSVKAKIDDFKFLFINIYSANSGEERIFIFKKFENIVKDENE